MTVRKKIETKWVIFYLAIAAALWAFIIYEVTQYGAARMREMAVEIALAIAMVVLLALSLRSGWLAYTFDERGITYHKTPSPPMFVPWGQILGVRQANQALDPVIADEAVLYATLPGAWKRHLAKSSRAGNPPFRIFLADTGAKIDDVLAYMEPRIRA
ncbi:MAG: hypothetical protein LBR44_01095 [Clostridiales Family XIII bacterium]|nr:hypothetical protein [Clostridiales Family XIII bacterium]